MRHAFTLSLPKVTTSESICPIQRNSLPIPNPKCQLERLLLQWLVNRVWHWQRPSTLYMAISPGLGHLLVIFARFWRLRMRPKNGHPHVPETRTTNYNGQQKKKKLWDLLLSFWLKIMISYSNTDYRKSSSFWGGFYLVDFGGKCFLFDVSISCFWYLLSKIMTMLVLFISLNFLLTIYTLSYESHL